jgi:two-component system nitrate/nitrite sensor histidine kinase NarX
MSQTPTLAGCKLNLATSNFVQLLGHQAFGKLWKKFGGQAKNYLEGGRAMLTSLRNRMGVLFLAFATLVTVSVVATSWSVATQQRDALVINLAGRQRMLIQEMTKDVFGIEKNQTSAYSLALHEAAATFEQTLHALTEGGPAPYLPNHSVQVPPSGNLTILAQLHQIQAHWLILRGHLDTLNKTAPNTSAFKAAVAEIERLSPQLLQEADEVVRLYETDSTRKVARLGWIQVVFFFSALGLLMGGFWVTQKSVIEPIQTVAQFAERIGCGDLETRVTTKGPHEIELLAANFETMRTQLKVSQEELESRVARRTRELTTAFEFSQEIVIELDLDRLLASVTGRARDLLRARAASLCLLSAGGEELVLQASCGETKTQTGLRQPAAGRALAEQVVEAGQTISIATACAHCRFLENYGPGQGVATPLRTGETVLGALCVVRPEGETFGTDETRALALLANSAATAIANAHLVELEQRQAQETAALAERERLAAELHDNLAQTLSFLNLKSDRLNDMLAQVHTGAAEVELAEMKAAINGAYTQVRAALVGLQTPATDAGNFAEKLKATVEEIKQTYDLAVQLNITDPYALSLADVAQKQALHIVREALTNAARHARARHVWARVDYKAGPGEACFTIKDDGCGFDPAQLRGHNHLGLTIMEARAKRCGGAFEVKAKPGEGTEVIARFQTGRRLSYENGTRSTGG